MDIGTIIGLSALAVVAVMAVATLSAHGFKVLHDRKPQPQVIADADAIVMAE